MVPKSKYIQFFNEFQNLRKNHNFPPEFIFNLDETMINVIFYPSKAIVFKDDPDPVSIEPKKLEHMTLLLNLPAEGDFIKPLVILPLKALPLLNSRIHDFNDISGNSSGWIAGEILKKLAGNDIFNGNKFEKTKMWLQASSFDNTGQSFIYRID